MIKRHHHPPPLALLAGCKWYVIRDGELVTLRPVELRQAHGTRECVHCDQAANAYCASCRRAVCWEGECFPVHAKDHAEWLENRVGWTKVVCGAGQG